ncbi:Cys-Cys-COOH (seleno)protein SaoC [Clostridioides difficile]
MLKRVVIISCVVIALIVLSRVVDDNLKQNDSIPNVNQETLKYFKQNYKEDIITCAEEDLNNDGKKDLVIIYKKGNNSNEMVVVVSDKGGHYITKPIPAPIENQTITFKNIDEKPPVEVIVSGSKNGNVGYAIYRVEGKKLVDLFGEDMDKCC